MQVDPAAAFAELDGMVLGDQPLNEVLQRTAELIKLVLPIPIEASVTLIEGDRAGTPAATSPLALSLDEVQYETGNGPCLASAQAGQLIHIENAAADRRWPEFARLATDKGVHASLSVPLPVQRQVIGALNSYAMSPGAFEPETIAVAEAFGRYAAVAAATTALHMRSAQLAAQMQDAMASRAVIEQAKGILMGERRCDADAAFDVLVELSQRTHRKLRDVAQMLVDQSRPA